MRISRVLPPIDAAFCNQRHRLAHRLDHGADQEVATQLHQVRGRRLPIENERPLADGLEERRRGVDGVARASRDDEQFACRCCVRTAEDGCRNEALPGLRMRPVETLRQGNADGARRDVDRPSGETLDDATAAQDEGLDRLVVCQHGHDDFSPTRLSNRGRGVCALRDQRVGLAGGAVVDDHLVARPHKVGGHAGAHLSQPDEPDSHRHCPSALPPHQCRTRHPFDRK